MCDVHLKALLINFSVLISFFFFLTPMFDVSENSGQVTVMQIHSICNAEPDGWSWSFQRGLWRIPGSLLENYKYFAMSVLMDQMYCFFGDRFYH